MPFEKVNWTNQPKTGFPNRARKIATNRENTNIVPVELCWESLSERRHLPASLTLPCMIKAFYVYTVNSLVNNVTLFLDTILQERNLVTKDS